MALLSIPAWKLSLDLGKVIMLLSGEEDVPATMNLYFEAILGEFPFPVL